MAAANASSKRTGATKEKKRQTETGRDNKLDGEIRQHSTVFVSVEQRLAVSNHFCQTRTDENKKHKIAVNIQGTPPSSNSMIKNHYSD